MTTPRISVVVAFFNNEDDLGDCLDSIAAQTFADLEVIMVDDASSDHSAEIARAKAAADPRFTLLQPEHGGPGGARNRGVERARGEYLAFVDGDDVLPANAYELLLHALERSGSDFVSGAVYRVGPNGISPSALHSLAIKGRQTGTHVTRTPRLLYDVSVWNKLFRRSFWDAHQLSYPEGVVWEDLRLMTKAHVLARAVDVIPDTVYYWRERAHGRLSITQSRASVANLRDRMTAMNDIDQFIAAHSPGHSTGALLRAHQRKALKNDLWLYVQDLHKVTDAYRAEFTDLVNGYLDHVGRRVLRSLPAPHKLAYHLVRIRAMPQLAELAAWMVEQPVRQVPVVRRRGRLRADLPFREDAPVPIPSRVFRPHWRDLDPSMHVDDIGWDQDRLVVTGRANVPSIDIPRRRNTSKIVVLRPAGPGIRRLPVVLPVRSFLHPEGHGAVRAGQVQLRLVGFQVRGHPPAVPRDRGVAVLHARPRARCLAPGPGAHPGARSRGAAAAASGGTRPPVRRPLGRSRPQPGGVAAQRGRDGRGLAGRRPAGGADRRGTARGGRAGPRPALLRPALLRPALFRPSWSWCATRARQPGRSRPPRWSPGPAARPGSVPSSRSVTWPPRPTWWTGQARWLATTGWPGTPTSGSRAGPGSGWRGRYGRPDQAPVRRPGGRGRPEPLR